MSVLIIEAAHWQMVRQLAYVALLDAARAGSTEQRRPEVMIRAFRRAIAPQFAYAGDQAQEAQRRSDKRIARLTDLPPWWIEIRQPDDTRVLHTRLIYLYEPLTPLVRALLRRSAQPSARCVDRAWAQGLLAIRVELSIDMHSTPVARQSSLGHPGDQVIHGAQHCSP